MLKTFSMTSPRGFSNVKNVFLAPFRAQSLVFGRNQNYIPVASQAASVAVGAATIAGAAFGAVKAGAALGIGAATKAASSTAAAASTAAKGGALTGTLKAGAIGAGAGFVASSLLRGQPQSLGQSQYQQPTQDVTPTQPTTSDIKQDAFLDGGAGVSEIWGGRDVIIDNSRLLRTSQDVYNYQIPTQTTSPNLAAYAGQEARQSGSTDFLIPALIIGAALFLK